MDAARAHTKIVIADGHRLFRAGLARILDNEPDLQVVGEAGNGTETMRLVLDLQPEVLLLELELPPPSSLEVLRQLKALGSQARPLLVSAAADRAQVVSAVQLGACGMVSKDVAPDLLVRAIRAVASGESWIDRDSVSLLLHDLRNAQLRDDDRWAVPPSASLTRRELEIIREVVDGASNKQIALKLKLSEQTVKNHLHTIFDKLGVSSRLELALFAVHHGIRGPGSHLA